MQGKILCGGEQENHCGKMVREKQSAEANFRPLKGEKDDVYRALRTINAAEIFTLLPARYEQFFVANITDTCERIRAREPHALQI